MVKLGKLLMTTEDFAMDVGSVAVTMFVFVSGRIDLSDEECFGDNSDDGLPFSQMKRSSLFSLHFFACILGSSLRVKKQYHPEFHSLFSPSMILVSESWSAGCSVHLSCFSVIQQKPLFFS